MLSEGEVTSGLREGRVVLLKSDSFRPFRRISLLARSGVGVENRYQYWGDRAMGLLSSLISCLEVLRFMKYRTADPFVEPFWQ